MRFLIQVRINKKTKIDWSQKELAVSLEWKWGRNYVPNSSSVATGERLCVIVMGNLAESLSLYRLQRAFVSQDYSVEVVKNKYE